MRLIIHIGAPKTGSSAIQHVLSSFHAELKRYGVLVPAIDIGYKGEIEGNQVVAFDNLRNSPDVAYLRIADVIASAQSDGLDTVVLSAENLIEAGDVYASLFSKLRGIADVTIIAYIRRQDDYIASAWQQWYCKVHSDLWSWLISELGYIGNWLTLLDPWRGSFGEDAIIVRKFDRDLLKNGDVVTVFFSAAMLPMEILNFPRPRSVNPSFSKSVQDLAEGNIGLFQGAHDNSFYDALYELLGNSINRKGEEDNVFSLSQRTAILKHYDVSNEKIREVYFSSDPFPLFHYPPRIPGTREFRRQISLEELRAEVDVLARAFLAFYVKNNK